MSKHGLAIKGLKWFRDIVNDNGRQYGIEVHEHLPQMDVQIEPYGYEKNVVRLPEQEQLIRTLSTFFGEMPTTRRLPDCYAATIQNATILGTSGMIVTPDGYLIAETTSMIGHNDGRCYTLNHVFNPSFDPPYKGHFKGRMLSLANPNGGYAHHLLESFASMFWFYGHDFDNIHTAQGPNTDRLREFMETLGLPTNLLRPGGKEETLSADFVSFFGPCSNVLLRKETVDRVNKLLVEPIRKNATHRKKVYFDTGRKTVGSHLRKDSNIEQVKAFLRSEGFEFIDLATLNIVEKIEYLGQVDVAVTRFGSSPANLFLFGNEALKQIQICSPSALTANSVVGNFPANAYTNLPILPVYKDFCLNKGNLMTGSSVLWCKNAIIGRMPAGVFYASMPSNFIGDLCTEVDIVKFKKFYNLFVSHYNYYNH